ncbi:MAG: hypothetical protein PHF46_04975, partial [Candidatus Gracilibacteria bacterium]|nr:hypothetical protein [Candidatus Gracilibacteria bacterium]
AQVKEMASKRGFASVSEYISYSVDLEQSMYSEYDIYEKWKRAEKEYKEGKTLKGMDILKNCIKG